MGLPGSGMIFLVCTDPPAPPAASWGANGALQLAPPACPLVTLNESEIAWYLLFGSLL